MFHVAAHAFALREKEKKRAEKNRLTSLSNSGLRVSPRESFERLYSVNSAPGPQEENGENGDEVGKWFGEQDLVVRVTIGEFNDAVEDEDAQNDVQVGSFIIDPFAMFKVIRKEPILSNSIAQGLSILLEHCPG